MEFFSFAPLARRAWELPDTVRSYEGRDDELPTTIAFLRRHGQYDAAAQR